MYVAHDISWLDVAGSLANSIDLISPELLGHHRRVSLIATRLAQGLGMDAEEQAMVATAGLVHDVGALSLEDRLELLSFDADLTDAQVHEHAYLGYALLRDSEIFGSVAPLVRFHHLRWEERTRVAASDRELLLANLLFLADRVEVMAREEGPVLSVASRIISRIKEVSGVWFADELVDALTEVAQPESFWLDVFYAFDRFRSETGAISPVRRIGVDDLISLSKTFCRLIDFRSRFTATHSTGVSAVAAELANRLGLSPLECQLMRVAGNLHDLGKLAVSTAILEKPGPLDHDEMSVMRTHTYHTYRILEAIPGFGAISRMAAYHHERLRGDGYPFRLTENQLTLGARAMAVADVFTAITEDRPYRSGMSEERALGVLTNMAENRILDGRCVEVLRREFEPINQVRIVHQKRALEEYQGVTEQTSEFGHLE